MHFGYNLQSAPESLSAQSGIERDKIKLTFLVEGDIKDDICQMLKKSSSSVAMAIHTIIN